MLTKTFPKRRDRQDRANARARADGVRCRAKGLGFKDGEPDHAEWQRLFDARWIPTLADPYEAYDCWERGWEDENERLGENDHRN